MLSTVQIIVGAWAHSSALIADGIHSLSDLF
ncbi:cation transporter, partial [Chromobacterium piscinae]